MIRTEEIISTVENHTTILENQDKRFVETNVLNRQMQKLTFEYKNMINKSKLLIVSLTILIFTALSAFASPRVYVAASGSDANFICALPTLPCRTISKALLFVDEGGEVIITESGDYEPFSIFRSVTVAAAPGVNAGIISSGSSTVAIGQEVPVDTVTIRNLNFINISGSGGQGIYDIAATNLYVDDCTFTGFSTGITVSGNKLGKLTVRNSTFRHNGGGIGINDLLVAGTFNVLIDNCTFEHSKIGVYLGAKAYASIRNSVFSDNSQYGIEVISLKGVRTEAVIDNCMLTRNNGGIGLFGGASIARLMRSTITQNIATGISMDLNATVYSFQNNAINGNLTDVSGSLTPVSLK